MVVDFIITSNCDKAIEAYRNMDFQMVSDRQYQDFFFTLTKKEQREIIYHMLITQAEVVRANINECKSTTINGFGTFKYREGKRRASVFKDKLANQYGFGKFKDIENEALRVKIINKVNVIKRDVFISEHIEKVKLGRSYSNTKVYKDFHFKRNK